MRLKSRGLGRKELVMDFREYRVVREGDEIVVVGTIRDPVNWDFSIRMCEDDLPGLIRVALQKPMLGIILRSLFRRARKHHWTQPRDEHLAEGRKRVVTAREKAVQRIEAQRASASESESETESSPAARQAAH